MLKKLIPGVLALAMFASVNANTDVETKEEKTVVEFVTAAKALGFSDEEVKAAVVTALNNADANGVVTLSLNNDQKKVVIAAVVATGVVALVAGGVYGYKKGYFTSVKAGKKATAGEKVLGGGDEEVVEA